MARWLDQQLSVSSARLLVVTLRPVENVSLPDMIFEQLLAEIVSGRTRVASALPSERSLTRVFGVNRHVVREALNRLEQVGLVRISQGGPTRVLDFRRTAGLDLLAVIAEQEGGEAFAALLPAAIEMRAGIGVDVARLCAERASQAIRMDLPVIAEELALVARGPELLAIDQQFWRRTLEGARNLAYQLAFNSLIRGVHAIPDLAIPWLEKELARGDYRRPIAAAIAAADGDAAAAAARVALTP
jgi:DNA-binding FadR family transcriptional regulator